MLSALKYTDRTPEERTKDAKEFAKILSLIGLEDSISFRKEKIKEKTKELDAVKAGKLYNPNCKDWWVAQLTSEIQEAKDDILMFEEAINLKEKK